MDVNKIKCQFVKTTLDYLNCQKYSITCCSDDVIEAYANYKAAIFTGCLLPEDLVCTLDTLDLTNYVVDCDSFVGPTPDEDPTVVVVPCAQQVIASARLSANNCLYYASLIDPLSSTTFARGYVTPDSLYVNAYINAVLTNGCTGATESITVHGGCTSTDCNDYNQILFGFGMKLTTDNGDTLPSAAFLTTIRFYETDDFGSTINVPMDIDVTPGNIYYSDNVDCPGCATVNPAHVVFGANTTNYLNAMQALFNNISIALYGANDKHRIVPIKYVIGGSLHTIGYWAAAKHQPSSKWFGFKRNDMRFVYDNGLGGKFVKTLTAPNLYTAVKLKFYKDDIEFTTPCGTFSPLIPNQQVDVNIDAAQTDFNFIKIANPLAYPAIYYSGTTDTLCGSYNVEGLVTLNTSSPVVSTQWLDPALNVISSTTTATVTTPGLYSFYVTLANGCVGAKAIDVPSGTLYDLL